ncbi:MerR family transcriptional regulator [Ferrovum sp. PN-J185]|uniref:MerR family transcriptional regulator n=1 Tax=Ferrovum sp. PN-J185 TaxID=1356306 RepID=UPI00079BCF65|nr:MerR family transcriptional regulator [Ferrovum sp. PN-J185]KXW56687.1 HTH-type transcriptional regulator MlrA [Ferrovum sp. PN-J185]MCC6067627.1 MerR family transcriptional regulator [Ferrovum sp. PN-J185]MDE1892012.1 MerR family transcriptional regulator [Betaproteobacteria bacterium]MDE2056539.1 MerR family transcriptional regulator [Betaproteobacteria bacterium]
METLTQINSEEKVTFPPIPNKRYFTIGEVGELCSVKPHVLRYWEQEFNQLKPVKRRGNRRYYQPHEVLLIRRIRSLLYDRGFTINGARHVLSSPEEKVAIKQLLEEQKKPHHTTKVDKDLLHSELSAILALLS